MDPYTLQLEQRVASLEAQIRAAGGTDHGAIERAIAPVIDRLSNIEAKALSRDAALSHAAAAAVAPVERKIANGIEKLKDEVCQATAEFVGITEDNINAKIERTIGASAADAATAKFAATSVLKAMADSLLLQIETTAYGERT